MALTAQGGQVVAFPAQATDTATAIQNDKTKLITLGSQISQLVQHYNQLKQQLMQSDQHTQADFATLLEQRKAAMQQLIDAHQAAIAQLRQKAQAAGVAIDVTMPPTALQGLAGLGQVVDTSSIQAQITTEQAKLTALQNYYTAYQAALAAGAQPPPVPAELQQGGFFGMSGTTIAIVAAAVIGALFLFKGK